MQAESRFARAAAAAGWCASTGAVQHGVPLLRPGHQRAQVRGVVVPACARAVGLSCL